MKSVRTRSTRGEEISEIRRVPPSKEPARPDEEPIIDEDVVPSSAAPVTAAVEAVAGAAAGAALGALAGPVGLAAGAAIGGAVGAAVGAVEADRHLELARIEEKLDEEIGVIGGPIGYPQTTIEPEIGAPSAASTGVGKSERSSPAGGPIEPPDPGVGGDTR